MDGNARLRASQNVIIRPLSADIFVVTTSISSHRYLEVDSAALMALSLFTQPNTPNAVLQELTREKEIPEQEFAAAIDEMVSLGVLIPATGERLTLSELVGEQGFADLQSHHDMLRDYQRTAAYRAAIARLVPGKSVLEIGCGTGILSIFAALAGARRVTAIEEYQNILELARRLAQANGCAEVIEFRHGNSLDIELAEPVDVIVHELIGSDPFSENMLYYLDDARRRFLRKGGHLIPHRLEICCYGIESSTWKDTSGLLAEAADFESLYGLSFDPYTAMLKATVKPAKKTVSVSPLENGKVLSQEARLYNIDLGQELGGVTDTPVESSLEIAARGELNALVLFFRAHLDEHIQVLNSPFLPMTSWGWVVHDLPAPLPVTQGEQLTVRASVETIDGRETIRLEIPS